MGTALTVLLWVLGVGAGLYVIGAVATFLVLLYLARKH